MSFSDLKLENILLDRKGNIKLTDFGLSKREEEVDEKGVYTGTYEYLSPEVILGKSASYAADWWSYAVVLFEMLCGFHPFYAEDRSELFERILYMQIELPDHVGDEAVDLLAQLLVRDPTQRLGCRTEGNKAIQNHPFFADINFDLLFNGKLMAPFKPKLKDDFDWSNFDPEFTHEAPKLTPVQSQAAITTGGCDGAKYANFSYVRPSFIADDKS